MSLPPNPTPPTHPHPQDRESAEPSENVQPMPLLAAAVAITMVLFGAAYVLFSDPFGDPLLGDRRTVADLTAKTPGAAGSLQTADGAALYAAHCAACHQATGQGLAGVFPPLDKSEWVLGADKVLANIVLHGITGDIEVLGSIYKGMMPAFNQQISDGDDLGAYDFGSVMHYPATAFSINGQATIVPRQPLPAGVTMGQRSGLSAGDINGVRLMYPELVRPTIKEVAKDPITDPIGTAKEVRKDPIRDPITVKEIRKDPIQDPITLKEVRKDPIRDPITIKEVASDPGFPGGGFPGPRPGFDTGQIPFVLAGASRYAPSDPLADAMSQVQQLAAAHTEAQQQADALAEAYELALQTLNQLQGQP